MLLIAEIVVSVVLVALVLVQERGAGLGGLLGGGGGSATPYYTRRGLEKMIYWGTIIAAVLFVALALANLIITK